MASLTDQLDLISKGISLLIYQIALENKAGQTSKNSIAEYLFLPVLRLLFSAPNLCSTNLRISNEPILDLADDATRISVQVTSDDSASKITDTLSAFLNKGFQAKYDRLVVLSLNLDKSKIRKETRGKWSELCGTTFNFSHDTDVVAGNDLFLLIKNLDPQIINKIYDIVSRHFLGADFVDFKASLPKLVAEQIQRETNSGKYIPQVYFENVDAKDLARLHSHPTLFFKRSIDSFNRGGFSGYNELLQFCGLPQIEIPDTSKYLTKNDFVSTLKAAKSFDTDLEGLSPTIEVYKGIRFEGECPLPIDVSRKQYYEENLYHLNSGASWLEYTRRDIREELNAVSCSSLILLGAAGQGKTNFICDFAQNFLLNYEVPCVYLTGREMRRMLGSDLGECLKELLFPKYSGSFAHFAEAISDYAANAQKPFVILIDGLNEHHKIADFSLQLEKLLCDLEKYPHIKLIATCRSEFFEQRFGWLEKRKDVVVVNLNERKYKERSRDRLVLGYFEFFEIERENVSESAFEELKQDMLLLRFFCEVYGRKGKPSGFHPPRVARIYHTQIFQAYLEDKLGRAREFLKLKQGELSLKDQLVEVLRIIVETMINSWDFSDVSISTIPQSLETALIVLLDEEIILRRDAAPKGRVFGASDERLTFTFDVFRDFLIANYLIDNLFPISKQKFLDAIARSNPEQVQITEGIKRFLFQLSKSKGSETFYEFYQTHEWYEEAFLPEIFYIEDEFVNKQDSNKIATMLKERHKYAQWIARDLLLRWNGEQHPSLNSELLFSVVCDGGEEMHADLIVDNFEGDSGLSLPSLLNLSERLSSNNKLTVKSPEVSIFRSVAMAFSVGANQNLESLAVQGFRKLIQSNPSLATMILKEVIKRFPSCLHPYGWKLLSECREGIRDDDEIIEIARETVADKEQDPIVQREAKRFLGSHRDRANSKDAT